MIDAILWIWLAILVIFLLINLYGKSTTFGMVAAFWLMILGFGIIITGVQIQTGVNETTIGDTTITTYIYSDVTLPFSTYAFIWGIIFIVISMYMLLANARAKTT